MAAFRQTTSRADDPQLHTHVVISAKVQTGDGRWLALDARYLKRYQRMLGGLYQSVLRDELTHRFGVAWSSIEHGQAELPAYRTSCAMCSRSAGSRSSAAMAAKRAEFIHREGPGTEAVGARRAGARGRRRHPDIEDRARRRRSGDTVAERGRRCRLDRRPVRRRHRAGAPATGNWPTVDVNEIVAALSARVDVEQSDVVPAICDPQRPGRSCRDTGGPTPRTSRRPGGRTVHRPRPQQHGAAAGVRWPFAVDRTDRAADHLRDGLVHEEADRRLGDRRPGRRTVARRRPSTGLVSMCCRPTPPAVAGHDRLVIVVGPAGTGKTRMLTAAVDDLHRHGRSVFGVAPSAKAARVLERETGMPPTHSPSSSTNGNAPTGHHPGTGSAPGRHCSSTKPACSPPRAHHLTHLAEAKRWRVVLVGDPHQLQASAAAGCSPSCAPPAGPTSSNDSTASPSVGSGRVPQVATRRPAGVRRLRGTRAGRPRQLEEHLAPTPPSGSRNHRRRWHGGGGRVDQRTRRRHQPHHPTCPPRRRPSRPELCDPDRRRRMGDVGDVVATRRNDRRLTTTDGEAVRNRETWTVTDIGEDGSLTVTHKRGHGRHPARRLRPRPRPVGLRGDRARRAGRHHHHRHVPRLAGHHPPRPVRRAHPRPRRQHGLRRHRQPRPRRSTRHPRAIIAVDRADIPAITQRRTSPNNNVPTTSRQPRLSLRDALSRMVRHVVPRRPTRLRRRRETPRRTRGAASEAAGRCRGRRPHRERCRS